MQHSDFRWTNAVDSQSGPTTATLLSTDQQKFLDGHRYGTRQYDIDYHSETHLIVSRMFFTAFAESIVPHTVAVWVCE